MPTSLTQSLTTSLTRSLDKGLTSTPAGRDRQSSSGPSYRADAQALFAQMTSSPDATRKGLINTFFGSLSSSSDILSKPAGLWVFTTGNQHDSLINWASPSGTAATVVGTPTFSADHGWAG